MTNSTSPAAPSAAASPRYAIGRLVALSDGVVAIAATLLVLPLVDDAAGQRSGSFTEFFEANGGQLLVFALSFTVILRFWLIHHSLFSSLKAFTPWVFWLNAVWLLSIVIIPFPTELIAGGGPASSTTNAVYVGTMLVTSLSGLLIRMSVVRHPEIVADGVAVSRDIAPSAIAAAILAVVLVRTQLAPAIGLWSLLLLFLSAPLDWIVERNRRRRSIDHSGPAR